jgi:hypothetical protein
MIVMDILGDLRLGAVPTLTAAVFALLLIEQLRGVRGPARVVVATIGSTVLLSVLVHGCLPLARWPVGTGPTRTEPQSSSDTEPTVRRLVKRS